MASNPAPWTPLKSEPPSRDSRFAAFAPIATTALCVLLIVRGHLWFGLLTGGALLCAIQANRLSPGFARRFERFAGQVAHTAAHVVGVALSWVLLSLVFVFVFVPVAVITRPFHRSPLGRPRGLSEDGWLPRSTLGRPGPAARTFGAEPGRAPLVRRSRALRAVAIVVTLLVLDVTAGSILAGTGVLPGTRGDLRSSVNEGLRSTMSAPPMHSAPWAGEFADAMSDLELSPPQYVPFLLRDFREFQSASLNTTDRERVSYQPSVPSSVEPLRVAFFGGSVMFGVGQRDEHTIPSAFARIAERERVPVEVHNYGFPGWVSWQEFEYYERLLAEGEHYDLVVFYDGFNDFLVQSTEYSQDPTHLGAAVIQQKLTEFHDERQTDPGFLDGVSRVWESYGQTSAIARFIDHRRGNITDPAGIVAAGATNTDDQARAALDIYGRSRRLIADLADDSGTKVHFFWQPRLVGWPVAITDQLPSEVIDLSHIYDARQEEVYIDEVHTNEEGARMAAVAMWAELGPVLERRASASGD